MKTTPHAYANTLFPVAQNGVVPASSLADRYGQAALTHGWTGVPTLLLEHRAVLGLSPADALLIIDILSYWRGESPPAITGAALAARMGCSLRETQRAVRRLRSAGLLLVIPVHDARGRQTANIYDPRPLLSIVGGMEHLAVDGSAVEHPEQKAPARTPGVERTDARQGSGETVEDDAAVGGRTTTESPLCKIEEKNVSISFRPPHPPPSKIVGVHASAGGGGGQPPTDTMNPDEIVIRETLRSLSQELGDAAPVASATRAVNLWRNAAGVDDFEEFLALLTEAAERTRSHRGGIYRCTGEGLRNGLPYLLAVLTDLLAPRTYRTRSTRQQEPLEDRAMTLPEQARGPRDVVRPGPRIDSERLGDGGRPGPVRRGRGEVAVPDEEQRSQRDGDAAAYDAFIAANVTLPTLWQKTLRELEVTMTRENIARWFIPLRAVSDNDNLLVLEAPTEFDAQWAGGRLGARLREALERVAPGMQARVVIAEDRERSVLANKRVDTLQDPDAVEHQLRIGD